MVVALEQPAEPFPAPHAADRKLYRIGILIGHRRDIADSLMGAIARTIYHEFGRLYGDQVLDDPPADSLFERLFGNRFKLEDRPDGNINNWDHIIESLNFYKDSIEAACSE